MLGSGSQAIDRALDAIYRAAIQLDPSAASDPEFNDPALWARNHIDFPDGESLTFYQADIHQKLAVEHRVCVRGPHGLGKTTLAAIAILWFADTRNRAGIDWKVVTTASKWRQLEKFLWPEVHKWARRLKKRYARDELFQMKLKLSHGEAFAVASDEHEAIEGAHADHILYIYDEAKAIPPDTYDATEGAFSGAGKNPKLRAYALAISTPGEAVGRFHDIQTRKPGYEDWHVVHVTLEDAIRAGRISREWAEQRKAQWGALSSVYKNRVEGNFAAADSDGVIPSLEWIERANERWIALTEDEGWSLGPLTCVTADVARSGADKTVLVERYTGYVAPLESHFQEDTTTTTARVDAKLREKGDPTSYACVDVIGIGAGVVDQLRKGGRLVLAFNASEGTDLTDSSGELTFANKRAAAWWNLREILDPANGLDVALPPDEELIGDLLAPKWRVLPGGRIQVERKDEIRKRLGRSTDRGDGVVMSFWDIENEQNQRVEVYDDRVSISAY